MKDEAVKQIMSWRAIARESVQGDLGLDQQHIEAIVKQVPGGSKNIEGIHALTPLQEGMLFHRLVSRQSDTYVLSTLFELQSRAQIEPLVEAINKVIARHDSLRSAIIWENLPRPVQVVWRKATLQVTEFIPQDPRDCLAELRVAMKPGHLRLDLQHAPIMQLQIAEDIESGRRYALLMVHHLICDHQSLRHLVAESLAHFSGHAEALPTAATYREYLAQPRAENNEQAREFFCRKLGDIDEPTAPFGLLDTHGDGGEIDEAQHLIESSVSQQVRAQAQRMGVSAARVFHAAWAVVIAQTCGRDDVVFGTVLSAGRHRVPHGQRLLGMLVNTLPLRLRLQSVTAQALIAQTHEELSQLLQHQEAALPTAQGVTAIAGTAPLFTSLLNFRHSAPALSVERPSSPGVTVLARGEAWTNYPITLLVDDSGDEFTLTVQTDRRVDPHRVAAYLHAAVKSLVAALADAPQTLALTLDILPESEHWLVTQGFNAARADFSRRELIHELFEAQVVRTPEAVAVVHQEQTLTYDALNRRANQVARHLQTRGIGPDRLVAICIERSLDMIVGLLGILKAGGAYLPLDPNYPADRLQYMLEDAAPQVVLTQSGSLANLPVTNAEVIAIDEVASDLSRLPSDNLDVEAINLRVNHLAYVIYTSGSTGKPKGVMVEHRNVTRLFYATEQWFHFCKDDVWTLFHSIAFDFSVWELWGALFYGGRLVVVPYSTVRSPEDFYGLICQEGVTILNQTPSAFAQLVGAQASDARPHSLRAVVFGGEALELRTLRPWIERNSTAKPQLINMYGITETTVHVTYRPPLTEAEILSERGSFIGRPIEDLRVYLLDRYKRPVPIGVVGELYVGGAGVARGYLGRPELTAERFLVDPFATDPQACMYKTGDLGRWLADGAIEYLGRNDHQVKIRGFRIELGEIEAQLARHVSVRDVAVLVREDAPGDKRLVAYVVPSNVAGRAVLAIEELRNHLQTLLPAHMVPSAFVPLEVLPLTANGKLDRRALPAPEVGACTDRAHEAPRGEVEEILAGVWEGLLRVNRVGRGENFFELGGHSLLIMQMMERLRRFGFCVDARHVFEAPTLADLARKLTRQVSAQIEVPTNLIPAQCLEITPEMLPLVNFDVRQVEALVQQVSGGAANIQDIYPLAPLQEGILFHHLMSEHGGDVYAVPTLLSVSSRARMDELIAALQSVIDRHDVLRTAVFWEQLPRAVQVVHRRAMLPVEEFSLDPQRDAMEQLNERLQPHRQRLDLRRAPLMRLQIALDTHHEQWYALLQFHHIVGDNTSLEILIADAVARLQGRAQLETHSSLYRNHVAQVLAYAQTGASEAFFNSKLGSVDEPTAAFGLSDVHGDGNRIHEAALALDDSLAHRIRVQARRLCVSSATLFHAAWGLVVARTSGRDDIVFGTVLLGRLQTEEGSRRGLGMFVNTLPLRLDLRGVSVKALVEQTQRELVDLLNHDSASLAEAQRCSGIAGSAPLFNALLNYRHGGQNLKHQWSGADGVRALAVEERTNYPITLSVDDIGNGFSLLAQTDHSVDPRRLAGYLQTAVHSIVEALEGEPQTPALTLSILAAHERRQVIDLFNATEAPYPKEKLMHQLFEEQVKRTPYAVAVIGGGQYLTYKQLNTLSNQLAHYLRKRGVRPDSFVGLCMERGPHMIVGLLGILKAAGAYVPLDPNYPAERLQFMLEDTRPNVVLTQEQLRAQLPSGTPSIALDTDWSDIAREAITNPSVRDTGLKSANLAYVIFTSGSTGRPKGVAIEHRNAVNLICWAQSTQAAESFDQTLQATSLNFDLSVYECFVPLATGGCLQVAQDVLSLVREPADVTLINTVPSALKGVLDTGRIPEKTRIVNLAGEALKKELVERIFATSSVEQVCNLYGPSETTTYSTWICMPREDGFVESIGRPIANTQIYILDAHCQAVPIGVVGEIYIGGDGVSRGYLNRPELTAECFVPSPFGNDPQARLYKTGDLGRWRANGTIDYLGRTDHQVKIRGFRVELGEIESRLVRHQQIKEAVVIAREDAPGDRRLVAYLVLDVSKRLPAPGAEKLRTYLKEGLPEHMVPAAFVVLKQLPTTQNGKLDRRSLPLPDSEAYASQDYEAPRGNVEEIVSSIWRELLRLERVGRRDNFFELGGHSLLMMQLAVRVQAEFSIEIPMRVLFRSPTIQQLAAQVEELRQAHSGASARGIEQCAREPAGEVTRLPTSWAQQRLWFIDQLEGERAAYRITHTIRLQGELDLVALQNALNAMAQRHEVLRTVFVVENGDPQQQIASKGSLPLHVVDLSQYKGVELEDRVREQQAVEVRKAFDLHNGPLIRVRLLEVPAQEHIFLITMHHAISDGWSMSIFIRELAELYQAHREGRRSMLEPLAVQYGDYAHWQRQSLMDASFDDQLGYWRKQLKGAAPLLELPTDRPRPAVQSYRGSSVGIVLDSSLVKQLKTFARQQDMTLFMVLYAAWTLLLHRLSDQSDVLIGMPVANRQRSELERVIGFFVNTLVLRLDISDAMRVEDLIRQVKDVTLGAYENQSVPFEQVVEAVQPERSLSRNPLFQVMFSLQNAPKEELRLDGVIATSENELYESAMFDLLLSLEERKDEVHGDLIYATDMFDRSTVIRWLDCFKCCLRDLTGDTQRSIGDVTILAAADRFQLIKQFNATDAAWPNEALMHELFEAQVELTPLAVAVTCGDDHLTYLQLNARANKLAHYLRKNGVGPDRFVGLCVHRGLDMIVALLGILKAGAAYLPLDPNYPTERLEFMLQDAAPVLVLTHDALKDIVPAGWSTLLLDAHWEKIAQLPAKNLPRKSTEASSARLAYVIYTSGSTGQPKGVAIEHRNAVNLIHWARSVSAKEVLQQTLQSTSLNFDLSIYECFVPLASGGSIRVVQNALAVVSEPSAVTLINTVPSAMKGVMEAGRVPDSTRVVNLAGEALKKELVDQIFAETQVGQVCNLYGPSETTTYSTWIAMDRIAGYSPSIGRPIANTQIYILDRRQEIVPIGIPGEIYIGGAGVARGYLNRPELTAERFIRDPFSSNPRTRMYRTGDLGRWCADGSIEYLGRNDHQVKIRGFRIELGEIEARLTQHGQVREAVVVAREDAPGDKRLVAYIVANEAIAADSEQLRLHLKAVLPDHMVPSAFVMLDRLPLTQNGKLDRRALPAPESGAHGSREYEAPQGEVEEVLAGIWQSLLRLKQVGRQDNFFELGGHSLLATRVISRIREVLRTDLPLRAIFDAPALQQLSSRVNAERSKQAAADERQMDDLEQNLRYQIGEMNDDAVLARIQELERELRTANG